VNEIVKVAKAVGHLSESDKLAIVLACLAGIMAIVLFLVEKTPAVIVFSLLAIVLLAIYPILHFVGAFYLRIVAAVLIVGGTVVFGIYVWPKRETTTQTPAPGESIDVLIGPKHHSTTFSMPREGWLSGYGSRPPNIVWALANTKPFVPYSDHVQILIVARASDQTIDALQDTTIEKSSVFHPSQEHLRMEMTVSQAFLKKVSEREQPEVEVTLVALPEEADASKIYKLADVKSMKGSTLITSTFDMGIHKTPDSTPNSNPNSNSSTKINAAPCSAVQVGSNNQATVNCGILPDPKISWKTEPHPELNPPEMNILFSSDHSIDVPAFAAMCDRPCSTIEVSLAGYQEIQTFSIEEEPKFVGVVFKAPRPLGAGVLVRWRIKSLTASTIPQVSGVFRFNTNDLPEGYR
jgi:hypothetical protein